MQKTLDFFKLVRFGNLLIIAFTQLLVRVYLTPIEGIRTAVLDIRLWCLILGTLLIAAAGYIINDYYDIKIDAVNRPERVLLGRKLKRRPLLIMHSVLNFLGISMAIPLRSWTVMGLFFVSANLLWWYSNSLKRKPLIGNLSVALLSSLAVSLPGIYFGANMVLLTVYTLLAFTISVVREILKDMEDIRGDKQFGCSTLPIVYGIRKTKIFLYSILGLFLSILMYSWLVLIPESWYLLLIVVPFSIVIIYFIFKADKKSDYKKLSLWCKIYMLVGVLSMILI